MTTTQPLPPAVSARESLASSRLLLWLPVPALVLVGVLLVKGYAVAMGFDAVAEADEFGFGYLAIVAACAPSGLVVLVLATTYSFADAESRSTGVVVTAAWTAVSGVALAGFCALPATSDGHGTVAYVAAGLVAAAPLALVAVARLRSR
ncbi:hypothetical protein [Nocardioides sp.]|uniref:hypothetical protein n=1 Tax=Nocardioides sp. TaxID=35761 RepID=UPI00271F8A2C|nr:hypothetical protein [Nocardioides sp.]MDO9456406.1 hypothetical protein [Nocardioides sp.]